MIRKAVAHWQGTGKEGKGTLTTQSKTLNSTPYSWHSRFEEGAGTNPEELIAAAHAGCFTMKLSFLVVAAGFTPDHIHTTAGVKLSDGAISHSHLSVTAKIQGISEDKFRECAEDARANCIVSKLLKAEITMEAQLELVF